MQSEYVRDFWPFGRLIKAWFYGSPMIVPGGFSMLAGGGMTSAGAADTATVLSDTPSGENISQNKHNYTFSDTSQLPNYLIF